MREYAKRQAGEQNTFENMKKDRGKNSQQVKEAKKLHGEVNIPEGPCGLEEIDSFQDYLGPQGFRIIVVDAVRGGVMFKGTKFQEAAHLIALVKSVYEDENGDYDGLYSIPGFMNRSYFCHRCCKGYNTEDSAHHNCQAQNCPACKTKEKTKGEPGCNDFTLWVKPDRSCKVCRRESYGEECFASHLIQHEVEDPGLKKVKARLEQDLGEELPSIIEMTSVCDQFRKCKDSVVTFKVNEEVNHKCLHAMCKHCLEYVNIYDHRCFITSKEEKHVKRTMRKLRQQKKKKKQLLAMVVEGLTDDHTQMIIDDLIAKRKKKLKELKEINSGIPMAEIKPEPARFSEDYDLGTTIKSKRSVLWGKNWSD